MRGSVRFLIPAALAWLAAACTDAPAPTASAPETPAVAAAAAATKLDVRDRYIVVFNDRVAKPGDEARQVVGAHGGKLHFVYEHAIRGFAATLPPAAVEALRHNPNVKYVVEDGISTLAGTQTGAPWGLDRVDQRALPLNGSYGYDNTGAGVNAYVLDSGIRFSHVEFGGRAVPGTDAIGDGQNGNDCNGHGTHVAGILGGATFGVAKGVKLISVRVFPCANTTFTSAVVSGLDWIRVNHVKPAVVNVSLTSFLNPAQDDAVKALLAAGITVVSAAGAGNADVCEISSAYIDGVITVGATDRYDTRYPYSNWGFCMDVFAPGVDIPSAAYYNDTYVGTLTGTSMAAPHVAGAVAQYLQTAPTATPAQAHAYIVNNATVGVVTDPGYLSPNRLLYVNRPVSAAISGTANITTAGSYTWTASGVGGNGSFTYRWEYRVQGSATWTQVATTASYSRGVAAGEPSFELRATVTSAGESASATQPVSVNIPTIAPVGVSITGPTYVLGGSTRTWYANPTGGTGTYTYQWQFRTESGTTWTNVGTGNSYTRTVANLALPFYLRVTVTSGGATAVDDHYVEVEPSQPTTCNTGTYTIKCVPTY